MNRFPLLTKVLAIGLVMLLLMAVLLRIDGLVGERRWRQIQAAAGIEQSLAGAQTLLGPLLQRQCVEEWDVSVGEGKDKRLLPERRAFTLAAAPHTLQVEGDLRTEPRYRGLFKVNGYAGRVVLQARWADVAALQPRAVHAGSRLSCSPARLWLATSDVRGLRAAQVQVDGTPATVLPGTGSEAHARGLHIELTDARVGTVTAPLAANITLELLGTTRVALVPAAQDTQFNLRSDWPHPSFGGRFLPNSREVTALGFNAHWAVSALASSAAADALRNGEVCHRGPPGDYNNADGNDAVAAQPAVQGNTCLDTLAVSFIDPVNPYVLTDRATKYALLFIVLTFACVALTEALSGRRVHPVQYTLVGLALALFYLLLLSLSEHIAFSQAYAAASGGCVLLLGFYARHMLGRWRAGLAFGAGVALLYGALWVLLQMEQTALVIGTLLLFGMLAAVMVLTRHVDWYALFNGLRRPAAAAGGAA